MSTSGTIEYYDTNADQFFEQTVAVDMTPLYGRFLVHLPKGGRILDAGCGSGRDAKVFLEKGYAVTAMDGSAELARRASAFLGKEVICCRFDEITFDAEFEGVWACASLLHVEGQVLPDVLGKLAKSLKLDGVLYMSFKQGDGERIDGNGRHFIDMTLERLEDLVHSSGQLEILETWETQDQRPQKRDERWWNCLARKK